MISDSRDKDSFRAKQEAGGDNTNEGQLISKPASSSRQWISAFRNPRIVRVSRTFGGKDRHSKVCTIRGLRDRRIRLSVPTAIQLYDLQDRLGLGQPSKVIDWLLDAAKDDVDKLPPLQLPQGFGQLYPNMMFNVPHHESSSNANLFDVDQARKHSWEMGGASSRPRSYKEVEKEHFSLDKGKWIKTDDHHHQDRSNQDGISIDHFSPGQTSSQNKAFPTLPSNAILPYNSYYHLDPSSLSLSQFGNHNFLPQLESSLNSSSNIPSGSQLFFCPPTAAVASPFPGYPPFVTPQLGDGNENSIRQFNHFQLLSSSSQPNSSMRPFHHHLMHVNPGFGDMQRNQEDQRDNDNSDT